MRVQHAAAAGAKHVPGEIEQAKPRGVQEAGNHLFFVEAGALGKVQGVDSIELMIFTVFDQPCDGIRDGPIGGLLQNRKLGLDVAHDSNLNGSTDNLARQYPEALSCPDYIGRPLSQAPLKLVGDGSDITICRWGTDLEEEPM